MDYISYVVFDFISYNETLMEDFLQWIADTLARIWDRISLAIWDSFSSLRNVLMNTVIWKIFSFLWDIVMFLLYGVRSIILLIWNLIYTIFNWFVTDLFIWVSDTFYNLSYYMWSSTSILVSLFILTLIIIWFQFLIRFFMAKYYYNKNK